MFTVSDLKQTKVYQEALDEGRIDGELTLLFRQLTRRIGQISPETESKIRALPLEQLEALGEALLDFNDRTDLDQWLEQVK